MTLAEFKAKYGSRLLGRMVSELIRSAPEFEGDQELAKSLGEIIADLESVLEQA